MMQLLLAEDNPHDVTMIREAIRTSPIDADLAIAFDGEQALNCLRTGRYDLVILDLNLPKCDGLAVLQRSGSPERTPPVVVFSGSSSQFDRELALNFGVREYVVKPQYLDEFIQAVQGILDRWKNHAASGRAGGE
jgi:DNA-binding response OmpR family regulator